MPCRYYGIGPLLNLLKEEGWGGDIASAAVPFGGSRLGRGAGAVARRVVSKPQQELFEEMMSVSAQKVKGLPARYLSVPSPQEVNAMFASAQAAGVRLNATKVKQIGKVILSELEEFEKLGVKRLQDQHLKDLVEEATRLPTDIDLRQWQTYLARRLADPSCRMLRHGKRPALPIHSMRASQALDSLLQKDVRFDRDGMVELVNIGQLKQRLLHPKTAEERRLVAYLKKSGDYDPMLSGLTEIGQGIHAVRIGPSTLRQVAVPISLGAPGGTVAGGMAGAGAAVGSVVGPTLFYGISSLISTPTGGRVLAYVLGGSGGELSPTGLSVLLKAMGAGGMQAVSAGGRAVLMPPAPPPQRGIAVQGDSWRDDDGDVSVSCRLYRGVSGVSGMDTRGLPDHVQGVGDTAAGALPTLRDAPAVCRVSAGGRSGLAPGVPVSQH